MNGLLLQVWASISTPVEKRLFSEYGAIFTTTATPPPTLIFSDARAVESFQSSLAVQGARLGEYEVELQAAAWEALSDASREMVARGGSITARAADSGRRSYQTTVDLWTRNVRRGLEHWQTQGRIASELAQRIGRMTPVEQVAAIIELEDSESVYFGTFFNRSILYSVAAPGASQHLSLLAFDVAEYQDDRVEAVLAQHGWHRTVPHDTPHFTYLGYRTNALEDLGLRRLVHRYGERGYGFWIPDLELLNLA